MYLDIRPFANKRAIRPVLEPIQGKSRNRIQTASRAKIKLIASISVRGVFAKTPKESIKKKNCRNNDQ